MNRGLAAISFFLFLGIISLGSIYAKESSINCQAEYKKITKDYKPPERCKTYCQKLDQYLDDLRAFVLNNDLKTNCEAEVSDARGVIQGIQKIHQEKKCYKKTCDNSNITLSQSQRGTFQILSDSGNGSSFFIGRSADKQFCIFATNAHVITDAFGDKEKEVWLDFNLDQKKDQDEMIVSQNICSSFNKTKMDLALIKVRCDKFFNDNLCAPKIISWGITPGFINVPKACEGVLKSEGFPQGKFLRLNCTAKERCDGQSYCFNILGNSLGGGSSGGPIFNTKGELCGFNTRGRGKNSDSFEVTKSQAILDFMRENCPKDFQAS